MPPEVRLQILQRGADQLRQVCDSVADFDGFLRATAEAMIRTMQGEKGQGLAAPQVGYLKRLIVLDTGAGTALVMVNPYYVRRDGRMSSIEGCLSVPKSEWYQHVPRAKFIKVRYQDLDGQPHARKAQGLFAACIQHEIDHLNGVLYTDYLEKDDADTHRRKAEAERDAERERLRARPAAAAEQALPGEREQHPGLPAGELPDGVPGDVQRDREPAGGVVRAVAAALDPYAVLNLPRPRT